MAKYVLALDAGTTSSRAILFNHESEIVSVAQKEFTQIYPKPGWVEHDPMEIWATQSGVVSEAMAKVGATADDIAAIGITNQRETTVVWDRATGEPVYNAIVWQCRRTASYADDFQAIPGFADYVQDNTGLLLDPYFSSTKLLWILDHVEGVRERAEKGELAFGTIDTWLLWKLTEGKVHATDYSNASRTMLFNIKTLDWDDELCTKLMLPEPCSSTLRLWIGTMNYVLNSEHQNPYCQTFNLHPANLVKPPYSVAPFQSLVSQVTNKLHCLDRLASKLVWLRTPMEQAASCS